MTQIMAVKLKLTKTDLLGNWRGGGVGELVRTLEGHAETPLGLPHGRPHQTTPEAPHWATMEQ